MAKLETDSTFNLKMNRVEAKLLRDVLLNAINDFEADSLKGETREKLFNVLDTPEIRGFA